MEVTENLQEIPCLFNEGMLCLGGGGRKREDSKGKHRQNCASAESGTKKKGIKETTSKFVSPFFLDNLSFL